MHKVVSQIRSLDLIEKELNRNLSGVLAVTHSDEERIIQLAKTFIYLDKNIYIFFDADDEVFENIHLETRVSFTVLKNERDKENKARKNKQDFIETYRLFSISIMGIMRKVEEQKILEDIRQNYIAKYSQRSASEIKDYSSLDKLVIIDTEEIQAFEETGG